MELVIIVIILIIINIMLIAINGVDKYPLYDFYKSPLQSDEKNQYIRLMDIFVLAPLAIWLGYTTEKEGWQITPYLLYTYAFGTAIFNFGSYMKRRSAII